LRCTTNASQPGRASWVRDRSEGNAGDFANRTAAI
jgi:hypothetical protein